LKPNPQITQENIEDVFTDIFGDRDTHVRVFLLNQRKENKLHTFWIIQAFLELEKERGEGGGAWHPLKKIKQMLVPEYIENRTSLFRLLDKMEISHIVEKKTELVVYDKSTPDKKKEDSFYRLSAIAFIGRMNPDQVRKANQGLDEQRKILWEKVSELQKQNSVLTKLIIELHLKLRAAKAILYDFGVAEPDLKINEWLQKEKEEN